MTATSPDELLEGVAFTAGPLHHQLRKLEERFADRHGAKHAVAVDDARSALELPLRCLAVAGHEVLVPANASEASVGAVAAAGARSRLVDVDPGTNCLDVAAACAAARPETAALLVEHVAGVVAPTMTELLTLCIHHRLVMLENAGTAYGAALGDRFAGTFGMVGAFALATPGGADGGAGDAGGIVLTDSDRIAAEVRKLQAESGPISGAAALRLVEALDAVLNRL